MAELYAIRSACGLAVTYGWQNFMVESDSKVAITLACAQVDPPGPCLLLKRIKWDNDDHVCKGLILKGDRLKRLQKYRPKTKLEARVVEPVGGGRAPASHLIGSASDSMLSYSGLRQGFWGEAMLTACYLLNRVNEALNSSLLDMLSIPRLLVPRLNLRIPNGTEDIGGLVKEAIHDEMIDLPPCCKPIGSKWIFKRKLKVDGTIKKFKARLVIQGFKQKSEIDYFDTYALVERISTIRLLIVMASIHNLIIHRMDVKMAFLNGELDKEVYMNQPQGFIMPGNENKVCKLIKSLYGLKHAPEQWHQKFDEVVLSSGIYLTKLTNVDLTKEFLSSKLSMKDMGESDVILDIRIKHKK
nr:zinc finger, CCHC-type [Tanacetum cinerariifolium]